MQIRQVWECTIELPNGTFRTVRVTVDPGSLPQARAEVAALREQGDEVNARCVYSRFVCEVSP